VAPRAAVRELAAPSHGAGALEGLYEAHAPDLRRRCMRLTRDAHAAEDLMQEVFVRFIARFPKPPANMNVGAYLHATARNVLWKQLRDSHETSDGDIETTVGADDELDNDPERSALLVEQQGLVRRCTAVLTGRQRRALTLRDVEGYSYAEIGSELGIGTGAVMQVISRARARLRVAVRRANVDLDGLAPECKAMLGPLSDYLDGRATSTESDIESHLATCDDCCQTLASFQEAGSRLRGFLPFVPLGGVLSRLRGRSHGAGSSVNGVGASAATHAPALARIGNALGAGGDSPLGVAGVGAMVTAAVIAVAGGGIVIAQHVSSGSGHALVAAAPKPKSSSPPASAISVSAPAGTVRATQVARSYGGHPYSPSIASTAAPTPASSAAKVAAVSPAAPATTPAQSAPAADPGTGTTPPSQTTPTRVPIVATPVPSTPIRVHTIKIPPVEVPPVKVPVVKIPVVNVPVVKVPVVNVPAVKVPVVMIPIVTTPLVTTPGATTPTVPSTPTVPPVPPVQIPAVPLAGAASFAVLAGSGVTNTGPTVLTGDLGSFPTLAITGLASLTLAGLNQAGGPVAQQAKNDLVTAYNAAVAKTSTETIAADLGGRTLGPGVYRSASSLGLTGALTLDGHGDPNAVFVFQAGSTLTTASASQVLLVNGARSCNVFWQVGSSATLGTGSLFRGNLLALTSITVTTGVTIDGRVLARNGAVTLDSDTIARSSC
jgi:RNA polymerase sigma factor (sigma-70 family)